MPHRIVNSRTRKLGMICYVSFDKTGQRDIVDLANQKEDILSPDFPFRDFVPLYLEWQAMPPSQERGKLFWLLRDMHQSAGVNKKSITFGADSEMELFWDYVLRIFYSRRIVKQSIREITWWDMMPSFSPEDFRTFMGSIPAIELMQESEALPASVKRWVSTTTYCPSAPTPPTLLGRKLHLQYRAEYQFHRLLLQSLLLAVKQ